MTDPTQDSGGERKETIDRRLLELLVCPLTKTPLEYNEERQELVSKAAGLAFPIREGVPLMTVEAARQLEEGEGGTR
ncbi:MAG: hypothetical protein DIU63_05375 [Proteobacteria bacterium]|jgi:hypothetical protein|nr:MAG: hypothetical protein DIU63_05375 [Pseudomonadota bacterium]